MKKFFILSTLLSIFSFSFSQTAVFFNLSNERIVTHPTLGSATAIDVMMHASLAGTYHSRGQIYLQYNSNRFGSEVQNNSNIVFEHGTLLSGTLNFLGMITPYYNTINIIDNSVDIVALTWQSNFLNVLPNPAVHNEVPASPTLLYTIYFKIQNASQPANLALHRQLMSNQQYLITDADNNGQPDEVPYANGFLPVEFMDFSFDILKDNQVQLNWITSKEINNDYFVVEKYFNDKDFLPLGQVAGFGTTDEAQSYHFMDDTEMDETNFYRIKQVDFDGSFTHSAIIEVHFSGSTQFVLYPTVTRDFCTLKAKGEADASYRIKIMDMLGRVLKEENLASSQDQGSIELNLSSYMQGLYLVQVIDKMGKAYTSRVIKI